MNGKHQLTIEGLKKCKLELEKLKTVDRPRIVEALKEARAQGDLSENAEYDAARDEQANIEARIKELENIIKNSDVIEINKKTTSNLGKKITVEYDDGFVALIQPLFQQHQSSGCSVFLPYSRYSIEIFDRLFLDNGSLN
jgi:transcription elongation GreA/GreB family factor